MNDHHFQANDIKKIVSLIILICAVICFCALAVSLIYKAVREPEISFASDRVTLESGEAMTLAVEVEPENSAMPEVTFQSNHPDIAAVTNQGFVKSKAPGTAVITCTSKKGQKIKAEITVKAPVQALSKKQKKKVIYLTFDDGPSKNVTPKLLRVLKKYNAKATFFVVGQEAKEYPDILKKEAAAGHTIGIHTYTHDYDKIYRNSSAYIRDFNRTEAVIKKVTGQQPRYWRFPGGGNNDWMNSKKRTKIVHALHKRGYREMDWNADTEDAVGIRYSAKRMTRFGITTIRENKTPVVLMHDAATKKHTPEVVENILKYYTKRGYTFEGLNDYYGKELTFGLTGPID